MLVKDKTIMECLNKKEVIWEKSDFLSLSNEFLSFKCEG